MDLPWLLGTWAHFKYPFFRIEWYREPLSTGDKDGLGATSSDLIDSRQRVYVYRHRSGISKPESHWTGRARHIYDTKKHLMRVKLSPLKLEDEAAYRYVLKLNAREKD
jgi:hypothetical protein